MIIKRFTAIAILVLVSFISNIHAQTQPGSVTGSITPDGAVRMIAHGESLQIRMEIYSASGELVSDSGLRKGNIIDWKQSDATQPLIDGSYQVVVTVKDFKGTLNQRTATLTLQGGQLSLQRASATKSVKTRKQPAATIQFRSCAKEKNVQSSLTRTTALTANSAARAAL
jgi:hypothetical protein